MPSTLDPAITAGIAVQSGGGNKPHAGPVVRINQRLSTHLD